MATEFKIVSHPLDIDGAKKLVGKRVKWKTPRYRIENHGATSERDGIAIYALPSGSCPTLCEEIRNAKPSQCYGMGNSKTGSSTNDRMIVRVERTHSRTGAALQPVYFSPRLSAITEAED